MMWDVGIEGVGQIDAPIVALADHFGRGRVVARDRPHALGVEQRVHGDTLGPLVAILPVAEHGRQLLRIAQPFEQRHLQRFLGGDALGIERHVAGAQRRQKLHAQSDLPGLVDAVGIDREAEGKGAHPLGHRGADLTAHVHGVARAAQVADRVLGLGEIVEHAGLAVAQALARLDEAQAAMKQAAGTAGRTGGEVALVHHQHLVARGGQMMRAAGPVHARAHDDRVELAPVEFLQSHPFHRFSPNPCLSARTTFSPFYLTDHLNGPHSGRPII
ncbi:MAG: hypothetical protein NTY59_07755 [Alphaproteobacteria bacterium]|nr:hypothetical protein [Alphaproteobacteria bacterium]